MTSRPSSTESELPADVLDLATCERDVTLDDLMKQRAYLKLQQVERALARLDDASHTACAIFAGPIFSCLASAHNRMPLYAWTARLNVKIVPYCAREYNLLKGWELSCANLSAPPRPGCSPSSEPERDSPPLHLASDTDGPDVHDRQFRLMMPEPQPGWIQEANDRIRDEERRSCPKPELRVP